jgi:hypothetical protein
MLLKRSAMKFLVTIARQRPKHCIGLSKRRKKRLLNRIFHASGFFYPYYPRVVLETKKRKRRQLKVTTKCHKVCVLKKKPEAGTSQAPEETQVQSILYSIFFNLVQLC